jgi:nitrate reductase gamma subunit
MLQAAAIVAVGAAAVAFVAGTGLYLYIRFTQHRRPTEEGDHPARGPASRRAPG